MPRKKSADDVVIEAEFVEHGTPDDDGDDAPEIEWSAEGNSSCYAETDAEIVELVDEAAPFEVTEIHWATSYVTIPSTDGYRIVLPTPFDGLCVGVCLDLDDLVARIAPEVAKAAAGMGLQRAGEGALHRIIRNIIPGLRTL